jgi:hypothetical protein
MKGAHFECKLNKWGQKRVFFCPAPSRHPFVVQIPIIESIEKYGWDCFQGQWMSGGSQTRPEREKKILNHPHSLVSGSYRPPAWGGVVRPWSAKYPNSQITSADMTFLFIYAGGHLLRDSLWISPCKAVSTLYICKDTYSLWATVKSLRQSLTQSFVKPVYNQTHTEYEAKDRSMMM